MFGILLSFAAGYALGYWGKDQIFEMITGTPQDSGEEEVVEAAVEEMIAETEPLEADVEAADVVETEPLDVAEIDDPAVSPLSPDKLAKIKGIGAVFAQRLADGGITRFEQLVAADRAVIYDLLQVEEWQKVDIEDWQQQAAAMAAN